MLDTAGTIIKWPALVLKVTLLSVHTGHIIHYQGIIQSCGTLFFRLFQSFKVIWTTAWQNQNDLCAQQSLRSASVFAVRRWVAEHPRFLHADSEDSDQSGGMRRLIWVFAWHKGNFVGFVMQQLILKKLEMWLSALKIRFRKSGFLVKLENKIDDL